MTLFHIIEHIINYLKHLRQKYSMSALTELKSNKIFNCLKKNAPVYPNNLLISKINRVENIVIDTLINKISEYVPEKNRNIVSKEIKKIVIISRVNSYFFPKSNNTYDLEERALITEICVRHKLFDHNDLDCFLH